MSMRIFAQITKVDEAKRMVYGRAVQETPDRSDEIFDYESSKPYFKAWSDSFADATDGKSLGNIRAMHGKVCAGKVVEIDFNDADKAIDIAAKVIDDNEWNKVLEGCYTGYSIGGSYIEGSKKTEKSADGKKDLTRYTANPAEISLVDLPCIPTAKFFDVVKADGVLSKVAFKVPAAATDEPATIDVNAPAEEVAATEEIAKMLNDGTVKAAELLELVKRDFTDKERAKAAEKGAALPDGSFPIESIEDLHNAIQAVGRAKDESAAKAHIIERAKALGATDELPAAWDVKEKAAAADLKKGMWNVADFVQALQQISSIAMGAQYDLEAEGDASPIPKQLRQWVADGVSIFKDMAKEESDEMMASLNAMSGVTYVDGVEVPIEAAARTAGLRKALSADDITVKAFRELALKHVTPEEWKAIATLDLAAAVDDIVAKAGARHSKEDMARLQKAHDALVDMGAACNDVPAKSHAHGDLAKVTTLEKALATAEERIAALEKQPIPARAARLRVVGKAADTGGAEALTDEQLLAKFTVFNPDGTPNPVATLIKFQQSLPGEPVDPRLRVTAPAQ